MQKIKIKEKQGRGTCLSSPRPVGMVVVNNDLRWDLWGRGKTKFAALKKKKK